MQALSRDSRRVVVRMAGSIGLELWIDGRGKASSLSVYEVMKQCTGATRLLVNSDR